MSILRDVKETVLDGQLGFSGSSGYGVSIRIGVSPISSDKLITISGDMTADTIKERLGLSPLADSVMDSVQFGAARVYCLPVAASMAGTVGEVMLGHRRGAVCDSQGSTSQRPGHGGHYHHLRGRDSNRGAAGAVPDSL